MKAILRAIPIFLIMELALSAHAADQAARVGDKTSHGGIITEGSANVFIGGAQAARFGDFATCPLISGFIPHTGGDISSGSSTVYINGLQAARRGDIIIENGAVSNIDQGSPTVFFGN